MGSLDPRPHPFTKERVWYVLFEQFLGADLAAVSAGYLCRKCLACTIAGAVVVFCPKSFAGVHSATGFESKMPMFLVVVSLCVCVFLCVLACIL